MTSYDGLRATVMGLGLFGGGVGAARFLAERGAKVTVTDLKSAGVLARSIEELAGLPLRFVLGRHDEADFASADLVVVNPGVPPDSPYLAIARDAGAVHETEIHLFLSHCRATVLGVTGSIGKTTTTSLLAAMLRAGGRTTWLGGNIGVSLLGDLDRIEPGHRVVLELSSFQLEALGRYEMSPRVAAVTNFVPNHLDHHKTLAAYARAKSEIVRYQNEGDHAVLNADDPVVAAWTSETRARVRWFSLAGPREPGLWADGDSVRRAGPGGEAVFRAGELRLRGRFNLANAMAAAAAALADGVEDPAIRAAVRDFPPVEHRLEHVGEALGATWYNDSKATTPESTQAALSALDGPIVLIAGGHDKGLDLDPLARDILSRAAALVAVGPMGPRLEEAVRRVARPGELDAIEIARAPRLAEAVGEARRLARPGGVVLLSPATSSYDEFSNFEERGRAFKARVRDLGAHP